MSSFLQEIQTSYALDWLGFELWVGMGNREVQKDAKVIIPLSTLNRHGLVSWATGTGKTKTLQKMIESLSASGVPTFVMDLKWDISWLALPWTMNEKIQSRLDTIGTTTWWERWFPCEFYSLGGEPWIPLKSSVSEFGPILFSRILGLNETQGSVMTVIFKYCDDNGLLLLNLNDIKKVFQYAINEGKDEIEKEYGIISSSTVGTIMRKLIELECQQADMFFGEPSFDPIDLLKIDDEGKGYINILRLWNMQSRPKLFSTFMLSLLSEIYGIFEEIWDIEKPKLVFIIDEAHLIFKDISSELLDQIEMIIKLIRSKWIGIIFCTQNPTDIPASILSQLGLKISHALRAFTAVDREAIKKASENFPFTEYYDVKNDITNLGLWEAFVSALNENGIPTSLVHTMILPPESRMWPINKNELAAFLSISELYEKYNKNIDSESAYEILTKRIEERMHSHKTNEVVSSSARFSNISGQVTEKITSWLGTMFSNPIGKTVGATVASELGKTVGKKIFGRSGATLGSQIARGLFGGLFQ